MKGGGNLIIGAAFYIDGGGGGGGGGGRPLQRYGRSAAACMLSAYTCLTLAVNTVYTAVDN